MGATYLYDLAATLLAAAETALDPTRTGVAAPVKVYVAHGDPVADYDGCCFGGEDGDDDQFGGGILTVHLGGPAADPLNFTPPTGQCQMTTTAQFTVTLMRCVPDLTEDGAPDATALQASARRLLVDLWALTTGLRWARRFGEWPDDSIVCKSFKFTDTQALPPQGGCAGWTLGVSIDTNDEFPIVAS